MGQQQTDPAVEAEQKRLAAERAKERDLSILAQDNTMKKQAKRLTQDMQSVYGPSMFGRM
jgi:uncharacterized protein YkwD